jgi:DNA-binding beta-propeller fold protein YncE
VYVTEYGNHRVSVFTCEGKFLTSFGTKGSGPGQSRDPHRIAADKNGVVYVGDD